MFNRKNGIDHSSQCVKRRLDGILSLNGAISVENVLKDFDVGHKSNV